MNRRPARCAIAAPLFLARVACILALAQPSGSRAREYLEGPVLATVERVIDGDTLEIRAKVWLGQEIVVLVRLRGIDAPELRGACPDEVARAHAATAALAALVGSGPVTLRRIEGDKYFGRVLADVAAANAPNLAEALLVAGIARRYDGGRRASWCG